MNICVSYKVLQRDDKGDGLNFNLILSCTLGSTHFVRRHLLGGHNFLTMTFPSAFAASAASIFIERPARRALLAIYVANEATQAGTVTQYYQFYITTHLFNIPNNNYSEFERLCLCMKALLNYLMSMGLLPSVRHGESMLFALTAVVLMWMYKAGPPQVTVADSTTAVVSESG